MAKKSPLLGAQPDTLSVCGKFLRAGQAITVAESALGPSEIKAVESGRLIKRKTRTPGRIQLLRPKA